MGSYWLWCWRRFGRRYSWMVFAGTLLTIFPLMATASWLVLRFEESDRYGIALAAAVVASVLVGAASALPGIRSVWGPVEDWQSDQPESALVTLESTYAYGRRYPKRAVTAWALGTAVMLGAVGVSAGAPTQRVVQYALLGATFGASTMLVAVHGYVETCLRPIRRSIAGSTGVGDHLPRARPTFAAWSTISLLFTIWTFAMGGAYFGALIGSTEVPATGLLIATGLLVGFGVPITLATAFAPSLQPLRELAEGTQRVAAGDFTERLPVDQDDDLGVLAASFNRMQDGLTERERLQAAFGSYVDPSLATRLLAQSDELFTGERVDVTVMFVDIRDFTPFAETNTAEDTVAYLNDLFEIVVTEVNALGGHVNKFLGDGAMTVFGAPERLDDHADRAIAAAVGIQRKTHERFGGTTNVGIGINTGNVIAGTIGGAGKLEFTLIGDVVNVAARVEQLTKTTDDPILMTEATVAALKRRPWGLQRRGTHEVKGKSEPVAVHTVDLVHTPLA